MPTPSTMPAISGESFLLGGSWRGCAYRLDGRAPSGPIFGMAPWRGASARFWFKNAFVVGSGLPGGGTQLPDAPGARMIVTVLEPGGGVSSGLAAAAVASGGEEAASSWRECCLPSLSLSRATDRGRRHLCGHQRDGLAAQRVIDESCPGHHHARKAQGTCKQL